MTPERALEINTLLCEAWFCAQGVKPGPLPVLEGISVTEAIEATEAVCEMPPERIASGWNHIAHVDVSVVPILLAQVVAHNALDRIQREHSVARERRA